MKKRKLLMTLLGMAVAAVIMIAVPQVSYADDSGISVTYKPAGSFDPIELEALKPIEGLDYKWRPILSEGDKVIITENGTKTVYYHDNGTYKAFDRVYGYYDNDGNALADRFRCIEEGYDGEISGFYIPFEWVDGQPEVSGKNAYFRFLFYEKDSPDDANPLAKSNTLEIYIKPVKVIDGIKYAEVSDGTAMVYRAEDQHMSEYKIRKTVKLDNGKKYKVAHIGGIDVNGSAFDDGGSFYDCEKITSINIPKYIKTIKSKAFFNTPKVKEVTIPSSVEEIGDYAFGYAGEYDFWMGKFTTLEKVSNFVIYAEAGSAGARYAKANGFKYIDLKSQKKERAADKAYAKAKYTPAKVKGVKAKEGYKKFNVRWKKVSKATGYQIRYSKDKSFKKNVTIRTVKKYKNNGLNIKKLKKNKKYYVQVRAYRKAKGKTYYGKWSAKKSVKVR